MGQNPLSAQGQNPVFVAPRRYREGMTTATDAVATGERCPECGAEIVLGLQEATDDVVLQCDCSPVAALA